MARLKVVGRWLGSGLIMLLITLLLLEGVARLLWPTEAPLLLFEREIYLLPRPLVSEGQLAALTELAESDDSYVQFDAGLGWSIRPNTSVMFDARYTSNSLGIRSLREYDLSPPPHITRLAAFGPSFTHGDEVSDEAAWPALIEQARPDLEVMNWGVGGYGTDQAFLRYQQQGALYQPQIVLIGFEENNLDRNLNHFRPFLQPSTGVPLTKPVFLVNGEQLVLRPNPFSTVTALRESLTNTPDRFLTETCPYDAFCDPTRYQPHTLDGLYSYRFLRTLLFEVQTPPADTALTTVPGGWSLNEVELLNWRILAQFIREVQQNGATPVVVAFPSQPTLEAAAAGREGFYQQAVRFMQQQGVLVVELPPAFIADMQATDSNLAAYYATDGGHFGERGNRIVAEAVLDSLCAANLIACP